MHNKKYLISGGGTGGHLFPAIAIGTELRGLGYEVQFIGSKFGIEAELLVRQNENPYLLNIRGIQRGFSLNAIGKNLLFPFKFFKSYLQARKIIEEYNPDVVIGTGGYSSGIPLLAAVNLQKKTLLQEQNSFPGITTRRLSAKVDAICIAFEDAAKYFKKKIGF